MKSIILAAGIGKRLRPITDHMPKCLIQFDGKPLIDHYFNSFNKCGINEVVLVVGYLAETLKKKLGDKYMGINVKYIYNRDYVITGSAYSLWLARNNFKESFILADSDVLFHTEILKMLICSNYENCLVVDDFFTDTGEEVKVVAEDGIVKEIGKKVRNPSLCIGEAIGFYKFSKETVSSLIRELEGYISTYGLLSEYEDVLNNLFSFVKMHYITSQGLPWIEIDFPYDLEKARLEIYPRILKTNLSKNRRV